jgi:hypothetical protein
LKKVCRVSIYIQLVHDNFIHCLYITGGLASNPALDLPQLRRKNAWYKYQTGRNQKIHGNRRKGNLRYSHVLIFDSYSLINSIDQLLDLLDLLFTYVELVVEPDNSY